MTTRTGMKLWFWLNMVLTFTYPWGLGLSGNVEAALLVPFLALIWLPLAYVEHITPDTPAQVKLAPSDPRSPEMKASTLRVWRTAQQLIASNEQLKQSLERQKTTC